MTDTVYAPATGYTSYDAETWNNMMAYGNGPGLWDDDGDVMTTDDTGMPIQVGFVFSSISGYMPASTGSIGTIPVMVGGGFRGFNTAVEAQINRHRRRRKGIHGLTLSLRPHVAK